MNITEMINELVKIRDEKGDVPILLAGWYDHYEIRWADHMEKREDCKEHFCIRIEDKRPYREG